MPTFRSNQAELTFNHVKDEGSRSVYHFRITIDGNDQYEFVVDRYTCPDDWDFEEVAQDMFGWPVTEEQERSTNELTNAVVFDESIEYEDVVKVERV